MAEPRLMEDAQFLRYCNIPTLINEMVVHLLAKRSSDPVGDLLEFMSTTDRSKYGPGKGPPDDEISGSPPQQAAKAEVKDGQEGAEEEEEDDPSEGLHDLSGFQGDLAAAIKKALSEGHVKLDLSKNQLAAIPDGLQDVVALSLEENQIGDLSPLLKMPKLQYLNISDNPKLKELPEGFGAGMKALKKIDAYKCAFSGQLSSELCKIPSLTYINFYNNGLLKAPVEINHLVNLTELNLASNKIMAVQPGTFDSFAKLKRLALFWNRLLRIPPLTPLTSLKELQLNGNQLPEMPELGKHDKLEEINLSENKIEKIHESLFGQKTLDTFSAGKNQLTNAGLQTGWTRLVSIRKICLPNNLLTEIPREFFELPNLLVLELNSNQIESLPEDIDKFETKATPLNHLFLAENKFKTLPKKMKQLQSLKRLALKSCPLDTSDATTAEVYQALEAIVKAKGVDGKFIDGKRNFGGGGPSSPTSPLSPTSLSVSPTGNDLDPEMRKKKKKEEGAQGGGISLTIG